jgi:glycosyltransferase involved in cell wall biosynthesis
MTPGPRLAIVVKGFPRLSETFIARELEALEQRGLVFSLHALRRPGRDAALVDNRVRAAPHYLPEYLHEAPARVAKAFAAARGLSGFNSAWRAFRQDLKSEFSRARLRRFGQACVLATSLPQEVRHIHAHFAHSPTSVARYAALMRGIGFSISAHAKDIWTAPAWDLESKLSEAAFTAVCNKAGYERLASLGDTARLHLIHHGLSKDTLANVARGQSRDGSDARDPIRIVCVARAVEKKGLRTLLDALSQLPYPLSFHVDHFGGGELLGALKEIARALQLSDRITWHGATPNAEVIAALDRADIFVLPAIVASDGDRDGIPNALLEAQGRGLVVLSTRVGGIEEAVGDGKTGRLVEAGDGAALAHALGELIRDPSLRERLGAAALVQARTAYDAEAGYDALAALLKERVGA